MAYNLERTKFLLEDSLRILHSPHRWTKGTLARDSEGNGVKPEEYNACQFCAVGVLWYVQKHKAGYEPADIASAAKCLWLSLHKQPIKTETVEETYKKPVIPYNIPQWNDAEERTHKEVVDLYIETIRNIEEYFA